jgi:hypothetical protein
MTNDRELLEMAAKAAGIDAEWFRGCSSLLRRGSTVAEGGLWDPPQDAWKTRGVDFKIIQAITALRAQLGQPEEKPVADVWTGCGECDSIFGCHDGKARCIRLPVEQQAEPVAWNKSIRDSVDSLLEQAGYQPDSSARHQLAMMNFDATSPQRKPLSDKGIEEAVLDDPIGGAMLLGLMRDDILVTQFRQAINLIARRVEKAHEIGETP